MDNESEINNLTLADFVDSNIISHGFVYYKRDYYFHIETLHQGNVLLLFKHCYELSYSTNIDTDSLKQSWSDIYIDLKVLQENGEPDGYPWAAGLTAYPGFSIAQNSARAKAWSGQLGQPMNELLVETDFTLKLIYHSWTYKKINEPTELLNYLTYPIE